jgi:luciferase family oxidoreductase group 1
MLPNHSPLVVAEQFGTLATIHPGRIDLGLGRAPGSDQATSRALRRSGAAAETFAPDVVELRGLLGDVSPIEGVRAIPGEGTHVPLYILGSSTYGAQLAALLGLPYAFASHFAPASLHDAVRIYRERFSPSSQLERPYVLAGVNVMAADTGAAARAQLDVTRRARVRRLFGRSDQALSDDDVERILDSPRAQAVDEMLRYTAVGDPPTVAASLDEFARRAGADELITVHHAATVAERLRSVELVADACDLRATERRGEATPLDGPAVPLEG